MLDLLVPILHYLNDARADQARVGLMHIGEHLMMPTTKMTSITLTMVMMMMPVLTADQAQCRVHALHCLLSEKS